MLALLPIIAPIIGQLIGLIPNPEAAAKAKADAMAQIMAILAAMDESQNKINLAEAGSTSLFVAGARPFIMWVCGIAFAWVVLLNPVLNWAMAVAGYNPSLPVIDTAWIYTVMAPMLGLGGLRTIEKLSGVQTNAIGVGGAAPRPLSQTAAPVVVQRDGGNG